MMRASTKVATAGLLAAAIALSTGEVAGQQLTADALVASLKRGGHVLVMRHASSPRQPPDKASAAPDNITLERQLDEAGRASSIAMGTALRDLGIPVGEVLSSPTYRTLETVRLAQLPKPQVHPELGDGGQSMQRTAAAQGAWLRERVMRLPEGTNTFIVTHMPNIERAFPDWDPVAEGEVVVVGSDGKGRIRALGRITIEEWPRLR